MSQIESGVRAILSHPRVYNAFQSLMGARRGRRDFAEHFVRAQPGERVLDVGCGTAEILSYLPHVEYFGFDVSQQYIEAARSRFGERGRFFCQELTPVLLETLPKFDLVLTVGLLHHLDDAYAAALLRMIKDALRPGGRLISLDPVFELGQNPIARFIVSRDRGQNVRTAMAYRALAEHVFSDVHGVVRHQTWIPYTHWIMECTA